jgi:hypothetical protein
MMTHTKNTLNIFALVMPSRIEIVRKRRDKQMMKVQALERKIHEAKALGIGLNIELDALLDPQGYDLVPMLKN